MSDLSSYLTLKLTGAFKEFLVGKIPRDDSLLEKLLSWLQTTLCDTGACERFLQTTGFTGYIKTICSNSEVESQVLSFILRLSGHIAGHIVAEGPEGEFILAVETLFTESIEQSHLWTQASIRYAWLNGMKFMVKVPGGTIFKDAYFDRILLCLEDSSWFVSKAAVSLLSEVIQYMSTATDCQSNSISCYTSVLDAIIAPLAPKDIAEPKNQRKFAACMDILENICRDEVCCDKLAKVTQLGSLVEHLSRMVESLSASRLYDSAMTVLPVLSVLWESKTYREEVCIRMSQLPQKLLSLSHLSIAMETAAWNLERRTCEAPLSIELENICLFPLSMSMQPETIESNPPLLLSEPETVDIFQDLHRLMNCSKMSHTSFVKTSLKILLLLKNHLIQRHLIFNLVKAVLEQATGIRLKHQLFLVINNRLKHQCLDILLNLAADAGNDLQLASDAGNDHFSDILSAAYPTLLLSILVHPDHDQVTVSKAFAVMLELLKVLLKVSPDKICDLLSKLTGVLERTTSHLNWDIRDTALSFVGNLLSLSSDYSVISAWAEENNIIQYIICGLNDDETFVRASSVRALAIACQSTNSSFNKTKEKAETLLRQQLLELCQHDAKLFSRRTAIEVAEQLYSSKTMPSAGKLIEEIMLCAVGDSDWDIKLKAVSFWDTYAKNIFDNASRDSLSEAVKQLTESGCVAALMSASTDCDNSVQLLGLKTLQSIRDRCSELCKQPLPEQNAIGTNVSTENDHKPYISRTVTNAETEQNDTNKIVFEFLESISIDFESLLASAATSTDQHDSQPESLLDDLLQSLVRPPQICESGFTSSEGEEDEDVAADCY